MFELLEISQEKVEDVVVKMTAKVSVQDSIYGTKINDFVCEGTDLEVILALDPEKQNDAFKTWVQPLVEQFHSDWINGINRSFDILETYQQKDTNGIVIKITAMVSIPDPVFGIRINQFSCEGDELESILAQEPEQQKESFVTWMQPLVESDHIEWVQSLQIPKPEKIWD